MGAKHPGESPHPSSTQVRSNGQPLAEFGRMLAAGTVRVATDSKFPLADAQKAHKRASRGHDRAHCRVRTELVPSSSTKLRKGAGAPQSAKGKKGGRRPYSFISRQHASQRWWPRLIDQRNKGDSGMSNQ